MGFHNVYVRDEKGCGTREQLISVLGVPQFFTPNGDGYNDYWNMKGANATRYSKIVITIYDRSGKLIKQITPSEVGWDGTYNSEKLPSDDYWYSIVLENGTIYKGHFSLKR
jgi:gliding motility-associated-like protein